MTYSKPVLVFVPGAWHTAEYFSGIISDLKTYGYEVHALRLPSVGGDDTITISHDATFIQRTTSQLVNDGKDVVLIMHYYGGIPGTESVNGLVKKDREAAGKRGGIVSLVYIAAFLVPVGESLGSFLGSFPDRLTIEVSNRVYLDPARSPNILYTDLPAEIGEKYSKTLHYQAAPSFATPLTYAAYEDVPTTYLLCE